MILPTRNLLWVDTVEKVGCMLHALTVRRQLDCRTNLVKVKRWTDLLAYDWEQAPDRIGVTITTRFWGGMYCETPIEIMGEP